MARSQAQATHARSRWLEAGARAQAPQLRSVNTLLVQPQDQHGGNLILITGIPGYWCRQRRFNRRLISLLPLLRARLITLI